MNASQRSGALLLTLAAMRLAAVTATWNNDGGDRLWNNVDNWDTDAVPTVFDAAVIGDIATPGSPAVLSGTPGICTNLTLNSAGGSCLEVSTDLAVAGTLLLANGNSGSIAQTAGSVTVTGAFNMAYNNWGRGSYRISGAGSSLRVLGNNSVGRYYGSRSEFYLSDGATMTFDKDVGISGQTQAAGNSTGIVEIVNGAMLHAKASLRTGNGSVALMTVSNANLVVDGTWWERSLSVSTIQAGATVLAGSLKIGEYHDQNARVVQEAGTVVVRNGLSISGNSQGGPSQASNCVYEMRGGLLIVTNGLTVGSNGHAVFRQTGGTAEVRTGTLTVKAPSTSPVSRIELSGTASFSQGSGTFYLGDQYDGNGWGVLNIIGSTPTCTVKALSMRKYGMLAPTVGPSGVAPLTVNGNATFIAGCTVLPSALPQASTAEQTILTWTGTGTTPANLVLNPSADTSRWNLTVDAANKRVLLRYKVPGTVVLVR